MHVHCGAPDCGKNQRVSSSPEERAIACVVQRASLRRDAARERVAQVLARHGEPEHVGRTLVETLAQHARVTLNFHPDRLRRDGLTVCEGLLLDGFYRNQFDTGVTNGSPTAFAGGDRCRWEDRLFGSAYTSDVHGASQERAKYGAFNVMAHADGGSPRFGSCYFELAPASLTRCTFTWGDSHEEPEDAGTLTHFEGVLAAWLEAIDETGSALGVTGLDVPMLLERLLAPEVRREDMVRAPGRALDEYIEAQVHGPIDLSKDVEALVIDPSFDGTVTGDGLAAMAQRYGLALRRHVGFVLRPDEVPPDFRGPRMRPLAERISGGAEFDAETLGRAAQSLIREPTRWHDWGSPTETWQHLKQLWHVLVRFGRARATP